jgi:hypothetical protein
VAFIQNWEYGEIGEQMRACPFCYVIRSASNTAEHVKQDHPQNHLLMQHRGDERRTAIETSERKHDQGALW